MLRLFTYAVAIAVAALAILSPTRADTVPPPGYSFQSTAPCREDAERVRKSSRPGQAAYDVCADQMALFAKGLAEAKAANKLLLVTFGATWCPYCAALQKAMPTPELLGYKDASLDVGRTFHHIEIGLSTLDKGNKAVIPSGEAVLDYVLKRSPDAKVRAIPFVAVIDPANLGRAFARNTDDVATRDGRLDPAKFRGLLSDAHAYARNNGAPPSEPGWIKRKWMRYWNG